MVAAWIDTTAGSTASARSAKLGRVVVDAAEARRVADRRHWPPVLIGRPGTVNCRPPARTMPKTTAPENQQERRQISLGWVLMSASISFLIFSLASPEANLLPDKFPRRDRREGRDERRHFGMPGRSAGPPPRTGGHRREEFRRRTCYPERARPAPPHLPRRPGRLRSRTRSISAELDGPSFPYNGMSQLALTGDGR